MALPFPKILPRPLVSVLPMEPTTSPYDASFSKTFRWSGYLIGFAISGFFDGILLHQVLQWHHLLSSVEGEAFRDLRVQILADGLFHVKMYVIAIVGLALLWRARREFAAPLADRLLLSNALIGFSIWHVVDAVLSHWLLGIHHIRLEAENVLLWDLIWFFVFGVAFIAAGWLVRRNTGAGGAATGGGGGRRFVAPSLLALAVLVAGPVAALPPPDVTAVMVLFKPGTSAEAMLTAVADVGGRIIWTDASGDLWAVDLDDPGKARAFYRHGALLVSNTMVPSGCLNWFR
jgi:uncharacterized membrane protein